MKKAQEIHSHVEKRSNCLELSTILGTFANERKCLLIYWSNR